MLPFAAWLNRQHHETRIVTGFPNYPGGKLYPGYRIRWAQRQVLEGVDVLRVPLFPSHDASSLGRIANYTSFMVAAGVVGLPLSWPTDVTYVLNLPTVGLVGVLQRALRGTPFVFNVPDLWPDSVLHSGMTGGRVATRALETGIRAVNRLVYGAAAAITVISDGFRDVLLAEGVPADKVHTVYNWVDEDLFRPVPRDRLLAAELGMDDRGKVNFVFAGSFGTYQGLDTLLLAAERLRDRADIRIFLIGTGAEEARLRALAGRLRLDNVRILARRPLAQMPAVNALSDVMLVHLRDLPFFAHTIPSKTQVGLASGRPLLVAVRGEAGALVERAGAGFACAPEDPADLARTIVRMAELSPEQRARMGRQGRDYYIDHMSMQIGATKILSLFEEAVARRRGSGAPLEPR